ncbi:hypothetical protein J4437_06075 [Candidatus Woesearchaeota archaeon]|nr:hypothetical protein [Candidatus Woesearchaeota archaeon]
MSRPASTAFSAEPRCGLTQHPSSMLNMFSQYMNLSLENLQNIIIRETGSTCIFFHNSCLSQRVLEGKHPSSNTVEHMKRWAEAEHE